MSGSSTQAGRAPAGLDAGRVGVLWLSWRFLVIFTTVMLSAMPATVIALTTLALRGRKAASRRLYRSLAGLLQGLGPTFVKFGQIMSSRRDALPPAFCEELAVLHDAVRPMTERQVRRALASAYGNGESAMFRPEQLMLLASGSIASVFYALWRDGGRSRSSCSGRALHD